MSNLRSIISNVVLLYMICNYAFAIKTKDSITRKNEITIGTTGFWLPELNAYHLTGNNRPYISKFSPILISQFCYEHSLKSKTAIHVSFAAYRSKLNVHAIGEDIFGNFNDQFGSYVVSAGISQKLYTFQKKQVQLSTAFKGDLCYLNGTYHFGGYDSYRGYKLNGMGVQMGFNEKLTVKNRYVIGLDVNSNIIRNTNPPSFYFNHQYAYMLTNALHLGIKF